MKRFYIFTAVFLLAGGLFSAGAQDMIIMRDGNVIEAKVTEISSTEIRYKRVDHLDGPTIVISTASVLSIRYENGRTEIINAAAPPAVAAPATNQGVSDPRYNTIGITLGYPGVSAFGFSINGTVSPAKYTFLDFSLGMGFMDFTFNSRVNFCAFVPFNGGGWYGGLGLGVGYSEWLDWYAAFNLTTGFIFWDWFNISYNLQIGETFIDGPVNHNVSVGYAYRFKTLNNSAAGVVTGTDGMVWIPAGTFRMGSNSTRYWGAQPAHRVTLSAGFYMGKHEVTQREYDEVMGTNPSYFKGPNLPVESVSWFDAVEYCNKRSQREGLTPAYTISGDGDSKTVTWNRNANGYRLPTEAEWEYACRAGAANVNISGRTGWYSANSGYKTQPVGQKSANAWGLHDMLGNVWEWCWDWYGSYASGKQTDPTGAASGSNRVLRGGGWGHSSGYATSANRYNYGPNYRDGNNGFRLVRN
jgi:formylglycine-generating enzyme required for sulfatase activity